MRSVLVASGGGHLAQLVELRRRLSPEPTETLWVTYPGEQARSILGTDGFVACHYPTTRSLRNALLNFRQARRILKDFGAQQVVSTGAGVAVPFLLRARLDGVDAHYIESAARTVSPSLTGQLLEFVPGVSLFSQYRNFNGKRRGWSFVGSVFDSFQGRAVGDGIGSSMRRVFISLGTHPSFRFDELVDRVAEIVAEIEPVAVAWQLGATTGQLQLPGRQSPYLGYMRQVEELRRADVVVAHAGAGIALSSLQAGKVPVLVPRRAGKGEHVDDHQALIGDILAERNLAVVADVGELGVKHLYAASRMRAVADSDRATPVELG